MHERHAKDGVVCISVSTDEKEQQAEVVKYLKSQKASFPNFLLDEEPEVWQEKLKMIAPPAVFVYDREVQWRRSLPAMKEILSSPMRMWKSW